MRWSDKSVESALNTYNAAIAEGVPDWFAMKLALDVAFEENAGIAKTQRQVPNPPSPSEFFLILLGGLSIICGIVVLIVAFMAAKG